MVEYQLHHSEVCVQRGSSLNSILLNYTTNIETLNEVRKGKDKYAAKGNGLLMRMETFKISSA